MEPMDATSACIVIGNDREVRLAQDMSALGCPTLLVTTRTDIASADELTVIALPEAPSTLARAVLEILPLQLLSWDLASRRGLRVDGSRYHQDDTKLACR
jgi:glucosamine--fructose-6-phosphate aminotransferase (isomerizing)